MGDPSLAEDPNVTPEELQLATRNHGMPLEGLRYDVTPAGMHYLLIHFDVPEVRPETWRLTVDGRVRSPLDLDLRDLQARETVTRRVTLECAGNGRARLSPRPLSQPWLVEAVGNAEWTGTPLAPILQEAGLEDDVVDLVFTGADHGLQGDVEQDYQRSLSVEDAMRPDVMLAWQMNGQPLLPQHGAPLRLLVPGWYGMTSVKWLTRIEAVPDRFDGFQMLAYRRRDKADDGAIGVRQVRILMHHRAEHEIGARKGSAIVPLHIGPQAPCDVHRPIGVQHQGPASPVDYHLVVEAAEKHAVAPAPAAAGVPRRHPGLPQRRPIAYGAEHDGLDPF